MIWLPIWRWRSTVPRRAMFAVLKARLSSRDRKAGYVWNVVIGFID
jgi:hypothetical protein